MSIIRGYMSSMESTTVFRKFICGIAVLLAESLGFLPPKSELRSIEGDDLNLHVHRCFRHMRTMGPQNLHF